MLDYYVARIVLGLCNGRVSVCPSVCPSMDISYSRRAAGLLLSAGVCGRYQIIAAGAVLQALSSTCG